MSSLTGSNRRAERLSLRQRPGDQSLVIGDRAYNLVLGLTVLWGLLVNMAMCATLTDFVLGISPVALLVGYLVCAIAGLFIAYKSDNPVVSFLGYNMVVIPLGLVITRTVALVGGIDTDAVMYAFVDTLLVTAAMVIASALFPQFFSRLGGVLFAALIGIVLMGLFSFLVPGAYYLVSIIAAVVFSLYIGYDFWRSQQYTRTVDNAVDSAIDIYMDIAMLFLQLVEIFASNRD